MIIVENLSKRYGPKVLFEAVSVRFEPGKRYALVGANGAGKSTFFRIVAGREQPDAGQARVLAPQRLSVLEQSHDGLDEVAALDAVIRGNQALWSAAEEKQRLLRSDAIDDATGLRLGELEAILAEEDGYAAEARAAELLQGLGIEADRHGAPLRALSGGQKARVLLARALFSRADVLLLDEPTNHLDLDDTRWLEEFLTTRFRGLLLVISHDREFLNTVATHVADVDYGTVTLYRGNYEAFVLQKRQNRERDKSALAAEKARAKDELRALAQAFQGQKRRHKLLARKRAAVPVQLPRSSVRRPFLKLEPLRSSIDDVLRVEDLAKSFGKTPILRSLSFHLRRGERLIVLGKTGIGKTTLLRLLVGEHAPDAGSIRWGRRASVGYLPQDHSKELPPGLSIEDWLHGFDPSADREHVRAVLGRLLFYSGKATQRRTDELSGGEVTRLLLARLILQKNNVFVLDEPTNHLDLESVDALCSALVEYEGTVIATSHNQHFISEVGTQMIELTGGATAVFHGTYEELRAGSSSG